MHVGVLSMSVLRSVFLLHGLLWLACGFSFKPSAVAEEPIRFSRLVISSDAPNQGSVIEGDPKQARQPIPASDAGDFFRRSPGFSAHNSGGTNSDPVLRGLGG